VNTTVLIGVVEGFYGTPWDLLDRIPIVRVHERARMIVYIYGPKLDPYHRERWRSPYPEHMLNEFSILVDE